MFKLAPAFFRKFQLNYLLFCLGVLFYVNKTGFPMADNIYQRMWDFACRKHPDGNDLSKRCQSEQFATDVTVPKEPKVQSLRAPIKTKLKAVQSYMDSLEYNHTGTQFFDIIKNRPLISLMEVCRKMVQESLPIKCLEATVLGIYLTNGVSGNVAKLHEVCTLRIDLMLIH